MAGIRGHRALLPWLVRRPAHGGDLAWVKLRSAALAAAVTGVVASPQLIAMVQQAMAGDASVPQGALASDYRNPVPACSRYSRPRRGWRFSG